MLPNTSKFLLQPEAPSLRLPLRPLAWPPCACPISHHAKTGLMHTTLHRRTHKVHAWPARPWPPQHPSSSRGWKGGMQCSGQCPTCARACLPCAIGAAADRTAAVGAAALAAVPQALPPGLVQIQHLQDSIVGGPGAVLHRACPRHRPPGKQRLYFFLTITLPPFGQRATRPTCNPYTRGLLRGPHARPVV